MKITKIGAGKYNVYRDDFCIALIRLRGKSVWKITEAFPSLGGVKSFKTLKAAKQYFARQESKLAKQYQDVLIYLESKKTHISGETEIEGECP